MMQLDRGDLRCHGCGCEPSDRRDVAHQGSSADAGDVDCLGPVVTVRQVEVHILSLVQRLVVAVDRADAGVVHKDVLSFVDTIAYRAEPVSESVVEPLDLTDVLAYYVAIHNLIHHHHLSYLWYR